ncbi:MAG: hypothetical protein N3F06_04260 [Nitrososphaerales archaeon]|nr:hypothetical protein [Nitrososphaerales archaeon]
MSSELGSLEGSWSEPKQLDRLVRKLLNRAMREIHLRTVKKNKHHNHNNYDEHNNYNRHNEHNRHNGHHSKNEIKGLKRF